MGNPSLFKKGENNKFEIFEDDEEKLNAKYTIVLFINGKKPWLIRDIYPVSIQTPIFLEIVF